MFAGETIAMLRRADWYWTSPALCARQTAAALACGPALDPDLRDCDYGRWAGRRLRDVERDRDVADGRNRGSARRRIVRERPPTKRKVA
jgi:broad specificity phosphatase PhoE